MKYLTKNANRGNLFVFFLIFFFCVLIIRLFYIQIIKHDYYRELANSEQIKKLVIPADRGVIYALDGETPVKIVMNETVYKLFADPMIVEEPEKIITLINETVREKARPEFQELLKLKNTRYQILATNLSRSEADKIKAKLFKGIGFQATSKRVYPEASMAAQVLGFVDYQGIGRYGIEGYMNDDLKGEDGILQSVTDIRDVPLTIGNQNIKVAKRDGDNIVLTIDRNIQAQAELAAKNSYDKLGSKNINIIVMDPNNGHIKAMVNYPSYNPSDLNKIADSAVFNNNTINKQYEPGSVMKTFTIAKGIDLGLIKPETTYNNTDSTKIDDRVISNATKGHTGMITIQDAYNWSLNTGMVEIMKILGGGSINLQSRKILYDFLSSDLGFGKKTGIELDGENSGILIKPDTGQGDAVRYSNMSFGQGLDVTMIQTISAFSALVNGGVYYQPTIISGKINSEGDLISAQPIVKKTGVVSEETSKIIKNMAKVGRERLIKTDPKGYDIGGKTGTSQVIKNGVYDDSETVASYLGFGGNDQAKYVIMVTEYGEKQSYNGSQAAMPVFNEISNWIINYLNIKPKD